MEHEYPIRMVVFDVEGVLIPKARFLLFDVFGRLGLGSFVRAALYGFLYWAGLISLKDASRRIFRLLKGFPHQQLTSLFKEVPLMPGVEPVFKELKARGFKTALISSGIPREGLDMLADRLGADYVSGIEIGVSGGRLTGEIWGDVLESDGKAVALKKRMKWEDPPWRCAAVADDRNNISLFRMCRLNIGYNPDFVLSRKADHVVKGELQEIIPILEGGREQLSERKVPKNAIIREAIHTGGFLVPVMSALYVGPILMASLIAAVMLLYVASETARMFGSRMPLFSDITRMASGRSEYHEFVTSPIFYALGMIAALLLFPKPAGYAAIAVLTLGDGFASLAGRRLGRRRISLNKNKSLEGSLVFFISAFLGSLVFVDPMRALLAAALGALIEVLPLPVNDNITIPLCTGLALTALS